MNAEGTHKLTADQQAEMLRLYGLNYHHVETGQYGLGMNRAVRRKLKRSKN